LAEWSAAILGNWSEGLSAATSGTSGVLVGVLARGLVRLVVGLVGVTGRGLAGGTGGVWSETGRFNGGRCVGGMVGAGAVGQLVGGLRRRRDRW
jgi:hypothetical protein